MHFASGRSGLSTYRRCSHEEEVYRSFFVVLVLSTFGIALAGQVALRFREQAVHSVSDERRFRFGRLGELCIFGGAIMLEWTLAEQCEYNKQAENQKEVITPQQTYFINSNTALVIAFTPVRIVGSGSGAK
jgi:hypothetical protein